MMERVAPKYGLGPRSSPSSRSRAAARAGSARRARHRPGRPRPPTPRRRIEAKFAPTKTKGRKSWPGIALAFAAPAERPQPRRERSRGGHPERRGRRAVPSSAAAAPTAAPLPRKITRKIPSAPSTGCRQSRGCEYEVAARSNSVTGEHAGQPALRLVGGQGLASDAPLPRQRPPPGDSGEPVEARSASASTPSS